MSATKAWTAFLGLGAFLGVLLSALNLTDWLLPRLSTSLDVVARMNDVRLPPPVQRADAFMQDSVRTLVQRYIDDSLTGREAQLGALGAMWRIQEAWRRRPSFREMQGCLELVVSNKGSSTLEEVTIAYPSATLALIAREGQPLRDTSIAGVLPLGTLRAKESITVTLWSQSLLWTREVEQIRVTHRAGLGKVTVYAHAGPVARWLTEQGGWLLFVLLYVPLSFVLGWRVLPSLFNASHTASAREAPKSQDTHR